MVYFDVMLVSFAYIDERFLHLCSEVICSVVWGIDVQCCVVVVFRRSISGLFICLVKLICGPSDPRFVVVRGTLHHYCSNSCSY